MMGCQKLKNITIKCNVLHRILGILLCLCLPAPLFAQSDSTYLPTAVVQERSSASITLTSVQQLSDSMLRTLRAHSVADALRYFAGVQIKDYGGLGGLKTVNVRGMGTQHVGVVLDGVVLTNTQNATIDLSRFSLEQMQSVTLYNGHHTRLLQPAAAFASSSAVFLQTIAPLDVFLSDTLHHTKLNTSLRLGSYATWQPSLVVHQRLSAGWAATLSANYLRSAGDYHFRYRVVGGYDTTGVRRNSDVEALRAELSLQGRTPRNHYRIHAYLYTSERGLPGAVVRGWTNAADRQWDTNLFLQSSWQHQLSPNHTSLTTAKVAYDFLHYLSDPVANPATMYADNTYRTASLYLSQAHRITLHRVNISAAADYRLERMLANLYDFPSPTRHTLYASVAAQTRWHWCWLHANVLGTFVYDHTHHGTAMRRRAELSPTLAVTYQPSAHSPLTLHLMAKHIFRMPTLSDLYYTLVGNTNLSPERTEQTSVGIVYHIAPSRLWNDLTVKVDAYHNLVRDKIVAIPSTSMFRWTMLNLGKVSIWGAEIVADTEIKLAACRLHLLATYTYERARDITDRADPFYGDQIPYIPRHSGSVIATLGWRQWQLRYSFIYTGDRYDQRANTAENFAPAWYTNDLAFAYNAANVTLQVEVNNLFNQRYEIVKGYPLPGTHFLSTLVWRVNL